MLPDPANERPNGPTIGPTDNPEVALPRGVLRDLPAILRAYDPDKKLTVLLPAKDLGVEVELPEQVEVADRPPSPGLFNRAAGVVRGRPKRLMLEVEIDLSTYEAPQAKGQGQLA
jgi:hypothetical protein